MATHLKHDFEQLTKNKQYDKDIIKKTINNNTGTAIKSTNTINIIKLKLSHATGPQAWQTNLVFRALCKNCRVRAIPISVGNDVPEDKGPQQKGSLPRTQEMMLPSKRDVKHISPFGSHRTDR